ICTKDIYCICLPSWELPDCKNPIPGFISVGSRIEDFLWMVADYLPPTLRQFSIMNLPDPIRYLIDQLSMFLNSFGDIEIILMAIILITYGPLKIPVHHFIDALSTSPFLQIYNIALSNLYSAPIMDFLYVAVIISMYAPEVSRIITPEFFEPTVTTISPIMHFTLLTIFATTAAAVAYEYWWQKKNQPEFTLDFSNIPPITAYPLILAFRIILYAYDARLLSKRGTLTEYYNWDVAAMHLMPHVTCLIFAMILARWNNFVENRLFWMTLYTHTAASMVAILWWVSMQYSL
ncbi:hypothetical protein HK098_005088, partial [Nowakowskiella sp. JEL0407]